MFAEVARAKVNLALHITGRRPDGYHDLETLVAFPEVGDRLAVTPADGSRSRSTGRSRPRCRPTTAIWCCAPHGSSPRRPACPPRGAVSPDQDAARRLRHRRRLGRCGGRPASPRPAVGPRTRPRGARGPVAAARGRPADLRTLHPGAATGIGHDVVPLPALPDVAFLLVNPGVPVATPDVFRALDRRDNAPLPAAAPPGATPAISPNGWRRRATTSNRRRSASPR